jgi:hypothetical protein
MDKVVLVIFQTEVPVEPGMTEAEIIAQARQLLDSPTATTTEVLGFESNG